MIRYYKFNKCFKIKKNKMNKILALKKISQIHINLNKKNKKAFNFQNNNRNKILNKMIKKAKIKKAKKQEN